TVTYILSLHDALPIYEIAFGEYVFNEGKRRDIMPTGDVTLVDGDYNIGVRGEHFQAIFSRGEGSLMSLKYGGQEMIQQAPRPMRSEEHTSELQSRFDL